MSEAKAEVDAEGYAVDRSVTVPGQPVMAVVIRRWVRGLLPDCPRVDDVELVAAELVNNSLRYGGGDMTVTVQAREGWVRLAVNDLGLPPPYPDPDNLGHFDCCLMITDAFAQRWGHDRHLDTTHTLWAVLTWPWEETWSDNDGSGIRYWLDWSPDTRN